MRPRQHVHQNSKKERAKKIYQERQKFPVAILCTGSSVITSTYGQERLIEKEKKSRLPS
jgi:hypothetical protein